jgi:cytochrome c biogenesis protein CcmG/thiol:disulfide interchange protein DsbE
VTLDALPDAAPVEVEGEPGGERRAGRGHGPHTARWIAGIVLVVTAALVALLATRPPATSTEVYSPLIGKSAPSIVGTTLSGRGFDLRAYRGRWVFVNFFASWCPPCQAEEPSLVTFAYRHRAAGDAALVGVVYDDDASRARAFEVSSGATWPAVVDLGGQIALRYGVRGPPETFLVSPTGTVMAHIDGAVSASFLDQQLAEARAAVSGETVDQ